jgi:hypothetical protein
MVETDAITRRFQLLAGTLDERTRRLVAAAEALSIGRGGSVAVARAIGLSRRAIQQGIKELLGDVSPGAGRVRREGGGRKKTAIKDPRLLDDLEGMMAPNNQGNIESPLRWTHKSLRQLTEELNQMGHKTSHRMVAELLHELGYNLKVNHKTKEGKDYAELNAQFEYIIQAAQSHFSECNPVISVEARKKDFVRALRNEGREWNSQDNIEKMRFHNLPVTKLGQETTTDVSNLSRDHGSIGINVDHDMETLTVESIQHWWNTTGRIAYAQSRRMLIITDGNGNNVFRTHRWKLEIQKLANETRLAITICYLPPGTSKWNGIEYQFFAFINQNWRNQPSISYEVIIKLVSTPTTSIGLEVQCHLDNTYASGNIVLDTEMASILPAENVFHSEWNYTIFPHSVSQKETYFMAFS